MASLKTKVRITDEFEDGTSVLSEGTLDILSGEISGVSYLDGYDAGASGFPAKRPGYDFSSGVIDVGDKELEFAVAADAASSSYDVDPDEMEEIRTKAASMAGAKTTAKSSPARKTGKTAGKG